MFTMVVVDVAFSSYFVEKVLRSLWLKYVIVMPLWWILQVRRLHLKVQNVLKRFMFCVQVTVVIRRLSVSCIDVSHELVLCHRSHHHCCCHLQIHRIQGVWLRIIRYTHFAVVLFETWLLLYQWSYVYQMIRIAWDKHWLSSDTYLQVSRTYSCK